MMMGSKARIWHGGWGEVVSTSTSTSWTKATFPFPDAHADVGSLAFSHVIHISHPSRSTLLNHYCSNYWGYLLNILQEYSACTIGFAIGWYPIPLTYMYIFIRPWVLNILQNSQFFCLVKFVIPLHEQPTINLLHFVIGLDFDFILK